MVYGDGAQPNFGYHMWNELFINGQWIPMDALFGEAGIGATHIKLAHSSLTGVSAISSLLPVIEMISRVQIEVLEVKHLGD